MTTQAINIRVHPLGILRKFADRQVMELAAGASPDTVVKMLGVPDSLKIVPFINGKKATLNAKLHDGDELKLVTLVTGG